MRIPCFTSTLISLRYCAINNKADDKLPTIKLLGKPYGACSMISQCKLCLHSSKALIKITLSVCPHACNNMRTDKWIFIKLYIGNAYKKLSSHFKFNFEFHF